MARPFWRNANPIRRRNRHGNRVHRRKYRVGVRRFAPATREIIAAGGGIHNRQLMAQLVAFLPEIQVLSSAEFGIDPDAKEAIAFAILAYRTWRKQPGNLPSATGHGVRWCWEI